MITVEELLKGIGNGMPIIITLLVFVWVIVKSINTYLFWNMAKNIQYMTDKMQQEEKTKIKYMEINKCTQTTLGNSSEPSEKQQQ